MDRQEQAKVTEHQKNFTELRTEYYIAATKLRDLRDKTSAMCSEVFSIKAQLFEAVGRELCAALKDDAKEISGTVMDEDNIELNDYAGMVTLPWGLVAEGLRFLHDYAEGKPAPRQYQDAIPF